MIYRWLLGLIVGTALVGLTSPWFVRSYVPRVMDPSRGVLVLKPGESYRWRSEGYAVTAIGPHGEPGRLPAGNHAVFSRVALWGDSQAEGVCVDDEQKIGAFVARRSGGKVEVDCYARSGDDCNDWIPQILRIQGASEAIAEPDVHVFLLVEWSDWHPRPMDPDESTDKTANRVSQILPAFVIQATRNVVTDSATGERRALRFRPGPVPPAAAEIRMRGLAPNHLENLSVQLQRLRDATELPCLFLYAPATPSISEGKMDWEDEFDDVFLAFRRMCEVHGFHVVDLRPELKESVQQGNWPRGFQNGQIGQGHYNACGNDIIAQSLVLAIQKLKP